MIIKISKTMAYFNDKFKRARLDQSPYLFHFVNGRDKNPGETLQKILEERKLKSDNGYICFSASPITAIKKFFETKTNSTGNPLYHPFGIGFSRDVLVRDFRARNVIYTDGTENIPDCLKWRTEKLDVDCYDFEYLREWRIKESIFDFSKFPKGDMIVIAPNKNSLKHLVSKFDLGYTPYADICNEGIEPARTDGPKREWKGIVVDNLGKYLDDYAVSGSTASQVIGEDMASNLFSIRALNVISKK